MGCLLTTPVLWLGWAVLVLSFGLYAIFEVLCGGFYKYQNLRQRYKAEWALVTGASSGECGCAQPLALLWGSDHHRAPCSPAQPEQPGRPLEVQLVCVCVLLQASARPWPSVWLTRA